MQAVLSDPESPLSREIQAARVEAERLKEQKAIDDALAPFQRPGGG